MKIRLYIITSIFILMDFLCYTQDPCYSNFISNLIYVNPAYVSSVTNPELSLTYRNQWPGLSGAFVNYGAAASVPIKKFNSGIGFLFQNDIQGGGIITVTSGNLIYAYKIKINNSVYLNAGLQASYYFENLDAGGLVFESDIRNETGINYGDQIFEVTDSRFWDFSLGFMAEVKKLFNIGFSVQHLTRPYRYFSSSDNSRLYRKYSLHGSCEIPLTEGFRRNIPLIVPSVMFQKYRQHNRIDYGASLIMNPLFAGIWTRNNLKFNFSSLTLAAGYISTNYRLIYSYDINLTGTNLFELDMGAHEVTFLLKFRYKEKRRNYKAIKSAKL